MVISRIYAQGKRTVYTTMHRAHSPAVRKARRPGAVLILRGAAAIINAGLHANVARS
jgi:hypothetical protein